MCWLSTNDGGQVSYYEGKPAIGCVCRIGNSSYLFSVQILVPILREDARPKGRLACGFGECVVDIHLLAKELNVVIVSNVADTAVAEHVPGAHSRRRGGRRRRPRHMHKQDWDRVEGPGAERTHLDTHEAPPG